MEGVKFHNLYTRPCKKKCCPQHLLTYNYMTESYSSEKQFIECLFQEHATPQLLGRSSLAQ